MIDGVETLFRNGMLKVMAPSNRLKGSCLEGQGVLARTLECISVLYADVLVRL